jgi:cytochrome b561
MLSLAIHFLFGIKIIHWTVALFVIGELFLLKHAVRVKGDSLCCNTLALHVASSNTSQSVQ